MDSPLQAQTQWLECFDGPESSYRWVTYTWSSNLIAAEICESACEPAARVERLSFVKRIGTFGRDKASKCDGDTHWLQQSRMVFSVMLLLHSVLRLEE